MDFDHDFLLNHYKPFQPWIFDKDLKLSLCFRWIPMIFHNLPPTSTARCLVFVVEVLTHFMWGITCLWFEYIYISLGKALSWYFLGIYWQNHDIIESKIFSHSVEKPTIAKPSNIVKNYILWSLKHIESKNFSEPWTEKCWILIERSGSNQCPRQCAWTFPSTEPKTY